MIEDKLLMWRFKRGSKDALRRIYEKYECFLLTLATALLNDAGTAEDVVQDFFVSFAQSAENLRLDGSLKGYLAACVANRARDKMRARQRQPAALDEAHSIRSNAKGPELSAVCSEQSQQLARAIAQLPYEQREVIILHVQGEMKFTQIAKAQNISVNTIRSRYRYGLEKLRALLNSVMAK
ncbi:MAG: RNA polymerase sigma factor [Planctomycetota bacterium]|jgi:RNA polymerase sigma-70 factor (ECF subfamily)